MKISKELEDTLIHFTHGRKLLKGEEAPCTHRARQPWEYIKRIEELNVNGVKVLYSELCELVHPAAGSVLTWFIKEGDHFVTNSSTQSSQVNLKANSAMPVLSEVLMAAYNPPIATLKVLRKFGLFRQIDALRKYKLDEMPVWRKISAILHK